MGVAGWVLCRDLQKRKLADFRSSDELVGAIVTKAPSECRCERCVQMCRTVPCLGTPDEIGRLMDAGNGPLLCRTQWLAGLVYGVPAIAMIQIRNTRRGCPMLRDGLCTLHAAGLKPLEGVRSTCMEKVFIHESATFAAALSWLLDCNAKLVADLFLRLGEIERSAA